LLFLVPGLTIDAAWKYLLALLLCFALGLTVEALRVLRTRVRARRRFSFTRHADAALYALQMFLAYCMMLLVMTYEIMFVPTIVVGLAMGHFVLDPKASAIEDRDGLLKSDSIREEMQSMSPCCAVK
jgi:hypothetical protein